MMIHENQPIDVHALEHFFTTKGEEKQRLVTYQGSDGIEHLTVIKAKELTAIDTILSWLGIGRASMSNVARVSSQITANVRFDSLLALKDSVENYNETHWLWKKVAPATQLEIEANVLINKFADQPCREDLTAVLNSLKKEENIDSWGTLKNQLLGLFLSEVCSANCGLLIGRFLQSFPSQFLGVAAASLRLASKGTNGKHVKTLIDSGIDVNIPDQKTGSTALILATIKGNMEVIKILLSAPGIDVNRENLEGKNALSFASFLGRQDIVQELITHGAISK